MKGWQMGQVQNYNLYVMLRSHEKFLGILCVGSTDSVNVAIAFEQYVWIS